MRIARYNRLALLFYLIVLAFSAPLALAVVQRWALFQQVVIVLWVGMTGGIVAHLILEGLPMAGDEDTDNLLLRLSGAMGLDNPSARVLPGRWSFWLVPPKSLVLSSGDELNRTSEWLQARVVISNTALQPWETREAELNAADTTPLSEGMLGLKLATAVSGGTGDRRLWLDQAKAGSTEAPRAILVDGYRRRDLGYHNYIIIGTVRRSEEKGGRKVWSNDLMRLVCEEDQRAADEVERLISPWADRGEGSRAGLIIRPSPFRPVWDLDKMVVLVVGADEASLVTAVREAFRDNQDLRLPEEDQFELIKRRTGRFFREFRFGEALAAFLVLVASILLKPYYSQAWFSFRRNLPTLTPRFWAYVIASAALGLVVGGVIWIRGEKRTLEKLAGSAFGLLNRMAARAEWAKRKDSEAPAARPVGEGGEVPGPTTICQFIDLVTRGSVEPLLVVGNTFGDRLDKHSLRNLLGLPFRMDTVDLALAYELMDAVGLATLGDNFRVADVAGLQPGGQGHVLGLTVDDVKNHDLIVLGSPLSNSFSNCLFRCGADYRHSKWVTWVNGKGAEETSGDIEPGTIRPGSCPFDDSGGAGCELAHAMESWAKERGGRHPLHPWTFEPEMITARLRPDQPDPYGFPWDTDVGLIQLVPNPLSRERSILLVFGYHRTGTDAAVSTAIALAAGNGSTTARGLPYLVVKKLRDNKLVWTRGIEDEPPAPQSADCRPVRHRWLPL